jgi:cyclophilin family peptidyl-prolyl cis-trans isomerase
MKSIFTMFVAVAAVCLAASLCSCSKDTNEINKPQMAKETQTMSKTEPNQPANPVIEMVTSKGTIILELDAKHAPITTANFVRYVNEGFYNGTIFHRVIPGFMIQGGGFTPEMREKDTHETIKNEASNGLTNDRGTIAMARRPDPDSASAQFFINLVDNSPLNYQGKSNPGYAVFGKVTKGMEVVDAIAKVKTGYRGPYENVPAEPVIIKSAKLVGQDQPKSEN